jgi:hypothetical protein
LKALQGAELPAVLRTFLSLPPPEGPYVMPANQDPAVPGPFDAPIDRNFFREAINRSSGWIDDFDRTKLSKIARNRRLIDFVIKLFKFLAKFILSTGVLFHEKFFKRLET